jgi:hypothetical protein
MRSFKACTIRLFILRVNKFPEDELGGARSTHRGIEEWMLNFSREPEEGA